MSFQYFLGQCGEVFSQVLSFLFGPTNELFIALAVFVVLDYITGVCAAIYRRKLSSAIGARGIAKKCAIFTIVSLSHIIDAYILAQGNILKTVTTVFYLSNECISILENVGALGLPLPGKLKKILEHFESMSK